MVTYFERNSRSRDANGDEIIKVQVLEICDPSKQESLDFNHMPDAMDVENDMPTELDVDSAEQNDKVQYEHRIEKFENNLTLKQNFLFRVLACATLRESWLRIYVI